ncbi:hypothetical protein DJ93_1197 [Bacillus clarus]|uniref:Uncharacterized protein n=2 Tax=Bacillus clarus TaxID=2338372 RepID=A0A090YNG3_9BACI|nr:hypothetical protein DJ93_1197 [Bacillus clarus]
MRVEDFEARLFQRGEAGEIGSIQKVIKRVSSTTHNEITPLPKISGGCLSDGGDWRNVNRCKTLNPFPSIYSGKIDRFTFTLKVIGGVTYNGR